MTKSTIASFTKRFTAMHEAGKKAAELVQSVGLDVLKHFAMHQDTTLVNAYFKALPPGVNYKAMTAWLVAFAAVRVNTGTDRDDEPFKFAKGKATDAEGAAAAPWYTMLGADVPKAAQVFDIKAHMVALVKRAAKAEKLEGDFQALRKAAIALGVDASSLPTETEASLKAKEAATGTKMAAGKKGDKKPSEAKAVDPLETAIA